MAISQSSVHKILQNENFCGIICKEMNIQARGSTPPPIHKPQQATPHGLLRLNRLNRLNCLRFFVLSDEIRTVQDWLKRNPRREVTAYEILNDERRERMFFLRFFVSVHQAAGKRQAAKPEKRTEVLWKSESKRPLSSFSLRRLPF